MRVLLLILLTVVGGLAEETDDSLTGQRRQQALRLLLSEDAGTRRTAHQALHQLSDQNRDIHRALLKEAKAAHSKTLADSLAATYGKLRTFSDPYDRWTRQCQETLEFAHRDLAGDDDDLRELGQLLDRAAKTYRQLEKLIPSINKLFVRPKTLAGIVLELEVEMALVEGEEEAAFDNSLDDVYDSLPYGDQLVTIRDQAETFAGLQKKRSLAGDYHKHHAPWLDETQRTFATILNRTRAHLGLSILYFQKQLCQANRAHSSEMHRLGYFSHTSPVPDHRSPAQRAANAGYTGNFLGENIANGQRSPQAAYEAWWNSDGHRKIMLTRGANHLGLGVAHGRWTLTLGQGELPTKEDED